jgi:hypothetical protein
MYWCLLEYYFLFDECSGDLHLVINTLSGLTRPSDLFIVAEVRPISRQLRRNAHMSSSL